MTFDIGICGGIIISSHTGYTPLIGSVGIKDGIIEYSGEKTITTNDAEEIIEAYGKIVMPGLINGHCHGDMTLARGIGDDLTLQEQMELFIDTNWFYSLISDEDRYYSRILTYIEAIMSGTTFILENMFWSLGDKSAEAMSMVKIKGGLAEDIRVNFAEPDIFLSDEKLKHFGENCKKHGLVPVIGSISEEDFETHRMEKIKYMADRFNFLMTCHLAENDWRVRKIREKFGTTPVTYLKQCGVLHEKLIGSHAIYIMEEEIKIMAEKHIKVVNTPLSEMKIADGIAPIPTFLKYGITVGIGTDGAMWNNSNDIFREMKGMVLLHNINTGIRSLTAKDVLDMATINGAKVFGLEKEIGTIEVGKKADIILIDANQPHMAPLRLKSRENVSSAIVYCATGKDVTDVFINGERIVQNRKLMLVDVNEVIERVTETSERIGGQLKGI